MIYQSTSYEKSFLNILKNFLNTNDTGIKDEDLHWKYRLFPRLKIYLYILTLFKINTTN